MADTCNRCGAVGGFGCYECTPDTLQLYTQEDLDAAVAAALREAAEAIDCGCSGWCMHPDKCPKEDVDAILSLIDPDAGAALDRYVKERSDEALREAADAVEDYCSDAPDLAGHGHSGAIRDVILGTRGDE